MKTGKALKVAYIHARPHGHPIHEAYANSLQPERYFIDFALRWHDVQRPAIVRYLSWVLCALFFPNRKKYEVFYADGPVHFLAIMKFLGLISKRQKLIFLMADETLFFIKNKHYSKTAEKILRWVIAQADGYICVGDQQMQLLTKVITDRVKAIKIINGIDNLRYESLISFKPNFNAQHIVCIANIGDSEVRRKYKGVDIIPQIINQLNQHEFCIYVVGEVSERIRKELVSTLNNPTQLVFLGKVSNLESIFSKCFLCIHPSLGEAWGISVSECMLAGLPVLVSDTTGSKELLKDHPDFILKNDVSIYVAQILKLQALSHLERQRISMAMKKTISGLTFTASVINFNKAFNELLSYLSRED